MHVDGVLFTCDLVIEERMKSEGEGDLVIEREI